MKFDAITHVVASSKKKQSRSYLPHLSKPEREHTPFELAKWLIELASKTNKYEKSKNHLG